MTDLADVRRFWEENPVAAAAIPHSPGTRAYFEAYDRLREANEPLEFSHRLHEYPRFKGKRVLDVGCGNGYVLARYAQEGAQVTGIDLTEAAVRLSQKRFELLGLDGTFLVANAEKLPFGENEFDCVCSMGVLHHTPDTARAVAEIHRVVKPGGRLIMMVYHRNSALYQLRLRLERVRRRKSMRQLVNEVDGVGNPKGEVYSRRELKRLLAAFDNVELSTGLLRSWMLLPKIRLPDRLLTELSTRIGWFLYAKATKPT